MMVCGLVMDFDLFSFCGLGFVDLVVFWVVCICVRLAFCL